MKNFLLALFIVICSNAYSQLATYDWSNRVSATATPKKALIDGSGNMYVWINNNSSTLTLNSVTYTTDGYYNFLVKYNSAGNALWAKPLKANIVSMCLTKDSSSVLVGGNYTSNYTSIDIGNGFSMGASEYTAAFIYKIDGATNNTLWVKTYSPLLPTLSLTLPISSIYETKNGLFCIQDLKVRKLDFNGNEIWNKVITANGTGTNITAINSFADDDGNQLYTFASSSGNTTSVTINAVSYTTLGGGSNAQPTYFSLDSSGNTNWVNPSVNFNGKYREVSKAGEVILGGNYIYNNMGGLSNHPFMPNYCNREYNVFKANLKTGKPIWNAYSLAQDNMHLASDGNLYFTCLQQTTSSPFTVGTISKSYTPLSSTNHLYVVRINQIGEPDSAFTVATLGSNTSFVALNFYRTNQGKFIYFFNRGNVAVNFNNGNANLNTSTTAYQGLLQFTPAYNVRHTTSWLGTTNASWFTVANWSNGIPTDSSTVVFQSGAVYYPTTSADFYNYATSQYAKCGTLIIGAGVNMPLHISVIVAGLIKNDGNMTWSYDAGYDGASFSVWSNSNFYSGYFLGNGSITYKAGNATAYNFYRTGNNKMIINLTQPTYTINPSRCIAIKDVELVKGNVDFSSTAETEMYVANSILFTPPARFLNGSITHKILPNVPIQLPLGNATNLQPASIVLKNTSSENYLKTSFTSTINGAAPNPSICIVNGQGIASVLDGGFWTITAATPLQTGAYYNANFKLKGSTNAIAASRYALLKRNNSSSNWEVAGTYEPAKDSASYVVSSANNITSFSDFAIGIANGVLPIHSIKLSVIKTNNINKLSWNIVASDADKIGIEKSTNAINFSALYSSAFFASGTYNDVVSIGKTYYRLKVSDKNGNTSYSNIVVMDDKVINEVKVYPTITKSFFTVQNNLQNTGTIKLFSVAGRLVMEQQIVYGTNIISIANLASQTYYYQIENGNTTIASGKIIKQ